MATTREERLAAVERALLREGARLRRARAQVAALRRANRRLLARGPQAGASEDLLPPRSTGGRVPAAAGAVAWQRISAGTGGGQWPRTVQAGALALDCETNVAVVAAPGKYGERRAALTPSEARLLALLMERPGRVWNCRDLARLALGYDVVEPEAVEIVRPHISRLRQKLEPDPLQPHLIRTVRGQGYLLSP